MKTLLSTSRHTRWILAVLLLFLLCGSVWSAPEISYSQAVPDVIFTGSSNQILITALVKPDSNLIPNSITVIRIDEASNTLMNHLYDDGSHGDELAGDNIYTSQLALKGPANSIEIKFAVTAAYKGSLRRIWSDAFSIRVIKQPSNRELEQLIQTQHNGAQDFLAKQRMLGDKAARTSVVTNLRQQSNVSDAGISSDGQTIWIRYKNGLEANILTGPPNTKGGGRKSTLLNNLPFSPISSGSPCECNGNTSQTKSKPLVLAPFFEHFTPYDESDEISKLLSTTCLESTYGGQVRTIKNSAANVDTMKNLYQYNVIYISTHGGVDSHDQVEIATGEKATIISQIKRFPDWLMGRITAVQTSDGGSYWAINPKFVNYYAKGRFNNSVVYLSACLTFGSDGRNQTLADTFKNNGASVYMGWQESVGSDFAYSTGIAFFNKLTNSKLVNTERTTGRAFDGINPKTEPKGNYATLMMSGSRDISLSLPQPCAHVVVSTSLQLSPTSPYLVGQSIRTTFTIANRGSASIKLSTVVTGGRLAGSCPSGVCPDFTPQQNIDLSPGATYSYAGTLTPTRPGSYTFSVAYQKSNGEWVVPVDPENGAVNKLTINVTESKANVVVSNSLKISPANGPYSLGQVVNGSFTITNRGNGPITMRQVLIAGRVGETCPNNVCPDFNPINSNVTLNQGQSYNYSGRITLGQPGTYTFYVAYQAADGKWEMPVKIENGAVNKVSLIVLGPMPTLSRRSPDVVVAGPNAQTVNLYGSKLSTINYCSLRYQDGTQVFLYIPLHQVTKISDTQIQLKYAFLKRGQYWLTAWTSDGKSNEFPFSVN
ncbi:MAG TPA: choice-of-anchor X domain-containing protein [Pyrinomonadaceae bacterium]